MTRYLLDTTALIDFSKGREPARSRLLALIEAGDELGVCAVNIAEFYSGIPQDKRAVWDAFIGSLSYWTIERATAIRAGQDRYDFARQGQALSIADTLVAAVARHQRATLVTNNVEHYPMLDIVVTSW